MQIINPKSGARKKTLQYLKPKVKDVEELAQENKYKTDNYCQSPDANHIHPITNHFNDLIGEIEEMNMNLLKNNLLAHYTSIDVLMHIINSIERSENRNTFVLRATNANQTNDCNELQVGYNFLMEIFSSFENIVNLPEKMKITNWEKDITESKTFGIYTIEDYIRWFYDGCQKPYIISLSKRIDELDLWIKPYGRNGEGVCLVFDFSLMNYDNLDIDINCPFSIVYGKRLGYWQITSLFIRIIAFEFNCYLNSIAPHLDKEKMIECKLLSIKEICYFVSSYFKSEKWHEEQESRIMCTTKDENTRCVRIDEKSREYVDVPIPISCLKEIIIGPKVSDDIVKIVKSYSGVLNIPSCKIFKSKEPLK